MTRRTSKRPELLREAARLFTIAGYSGTSMDDIAAAAGVTKASMYHHFRTKSDLLYEIYARVADAIGDRLAKQPADLTPPERLQQTIRDVLDIQSEMSTEARVFTQESPMLRDSLPREQAVELRAKEAAFTDHLVTIFEDGIRDGSIRPMDPVVAAHALIGMVSGIARWYRADGRLSIRQIADLFVSIALHGVDAAGRQRILEDVPPER